jgi:hypothetical protein
MSRLRLPILSSLGWTLPALCIGACVAPSDSSDEVFVTVEAPSHVVIQGRDVSLVARTWRRTSVGAVEPVAGVSYRWQTRGEGIVDLASSRDKATMTGVSRGLDSVFATAVDFEDATPGSWEVRVTASVEIDEVSPASVRYGEEVTVRGVGLGRVVRFALGEADLIPDVGSFSGDSAGFGELRLWVPFPARSDRLVAVTPEGLSTAADDTTTVVQLDPFEPNDERGSIVRLEPGVGNEAMPLFLNPALALESGGIDRYRIVTSDRARPLTFLLSTASLVASEFEVDLSAGGQPWRIGIREQECRGDLVTMGSITPDTVVRAFTGLPADTLDMVVQGPPSRYHMRILDGYRLQDPAIGPDRFEDNDDCVAADDPTKLVDLSSPFSDSVTIDNGYELDWYRFLVPGADSQLVTIRTRADPIGAVDSSDIALSLLTAPQPGPDPVARSDVEGSTEVLSLALQPGEYYLLVSDGGGSAVRYALCLGLGSSCPLP